MKDLHHPYIVQFLGFSHHQSLKTLSLVMEYLPGGSLEDYVSTHRNVPLHLRQRWSGQMAQALAYLHNRKPGFLIHRMYLDQEYFCMPLFYDSISIMKDHGRDFNMASSFSPPIWKGF